MAGNFPGISNSQQNGVKGEPLDGALLSVYNGGTNVLSLCYQDIGLSIAAPNPLVADPSGRIPMFFVPDGTYRVRLTDKYGSTSNGGFDYPQVPSIGASSSGGGGTAVDPTTILQTGDPFFVAIDGVRSGFVRLNGRTIGNAISGASERAAADVQALFIYNYTNYSDVICPVVGGRGANALADFNAGKQLTLMDWRLLTPIGMSTMGNIASTRAPGLPVVSGSASTPASIVGEATHALTSNENGPHNHTLTDPGHAHSYTQPGPIVGGSGGAAHANTDPGTTGPSTTGITLASSGLGTPHNNIGLSITGTWYQKI